jgi:hypothetical protein
VSETSHLARSNEKSYGALKKKEDIEWVVATREKLYLILWLL